MYTSRPASVSNNNAPRCGPPLWPGLRRQSFRLAVYSKQEYPSGWKMPTGCLDPTTRRRRRLRHRRPCPIPRDCWHPTSNRVHRNCWHPTSNRDERPMFWLGCSRNVVAPERFPCRSCYHRYDGIVGRRVSVIQWLLFLLERVTCAQPQHKRQERA